MRDAVNRARSAIVDVWSMRTRPQALAAAVAFGLFGAGVVHVGVFLVDGGPWSGALGWRKPITFGLSFGVTLLSFAWIATYVRLSLRREWWILGSLAVASAVEYTLITLQAWRGVPWHFNVGTGRNTAIWVAMGIGIGVIVIATVALTAAALQRVDASPSFALAIRAGLALLLVGYAVGGLILGSGGGAAEFPTGDESILGAAGGLVFLAALAVALVLALALRALQRPTARSVALD